MEKKKKKSFKENYTEFITEFKKFALEGLALSAAVGIMLGAALRDVINSLVSDILTPPISHLTSGIDFTTRYIILGNNNYESLAEAQEAGAAIIFYGNFINELLTFLITAFILFLLIYQTTKLSSRFRKKKETEEEKEVKRLCQYCKSEVHKDATKCPNCTSNLGK